MNKKSSARVDIQGGVKNYMEERKPKSQISKCNFKRLQMFRGRTHSFLYGDTFLE